MDKALTISSFEKMVEEVNPISLILEKLGIVPTDPQSFVTLRLGESKKLNDGTIVTFTNPKIYDATMKYHGEMNIVKYPRTYVSYYVAPILKFEYPDGKFDYAHLNANGYLELTNAYAFVTNRLYDLKDDVGATYGIFAASEYTDEYSNGKIRYISVKRQYKTTAIRWNNLKMMKDWYCPDYRATIQFVNQYDLKSIKSDVVNKFDIGSFEITLKDDDQYIFLPKKVKRQSELPLLYFKKVNSTIVTAMKDGIITPKMYTQYGEVNTKEIKVSNRIKELYKED